MHDTQHSRFRDTNNVEPIGLAAQVALDKHWAINGRIHCLYMSINDTSNLQSKGMELLRRKPSLYCINDDMTEARSLEEMFKLLPHQRTVQYAKVSKKKKRKYSAIDVQRLTF